MQKNWIRIPVMLTLAGLLSACVTINIYFPAAAAEKVADRLLDDIWGTDAPDAQKPTNGEVQK
jgi:hypothetical protein